MKILLYCTKAKPYLYQSYEYEAFGEDDLGRFYIDNEERLETKLNGKIVAECDCEKVEKISCRCVPYRNNNNLGYEYFLDNGVYKVEWNKHNIVDEKPEAYKDSAVVFERSDRYIDTMFKNKDLQQMCLSPQALLDYIKLGNDGYTLHLSNVKVFYEPKELNEFYKDDFLQELNEENTRIKKAPQNMCYVYDKKGNKYVLISIRPEWLCKILNGEKTIEIRKQIVKELKELGE